MTVLPSYPLAVRLFRLNLLGATALVGFTSPAVAQEAPTMTPAQATSPEPTRVDADDAGDIVVTALRRDTTLQRTPIAISAVTGETLANSGVQSIADLGSTTPSLSFVDGGPSQRRVVIRGIQGAGEPLVGTYYDDTAVTGSPGASNDAGGSTPELRLFDVQRVEVLRGPQGTLYGAGSMGGTLRVIYNKPTMKTEVAMDTSLSATQDGGLNYEGSAMINVPLVQDKLAVRAVGYYRTADGYIDNTRLGINNVNDLESYGGRVLVRFTPTSDLTIDATAYVNRSTTDTPAWTLGSGRYTSDQYTRLPVSDGLELYSLNAKYQFSGVSLTAIGSYLHRDFEAGNTDTSFYVRSTRTPARCAALANSGSTCSSTQLASYYALVDGQSTSLLLPEQDMNTWTGELRLASERTGPLNWTLGAFYSNRKTAVANPQVNADPTTGEVIYPLQYDTLRFIDDKLEQKAVYGELSLDATDKLNLTVGGRYFNYNRRIVGSTTVPSILVGARITPPTTVTSKEDGVVFRFNGSYKITPDIMVYAEAAQGFRPGGANQVLGLDAALTPYESDSLWNYEAGIKNSLFNNRLTLNVDVFQIDWSDMQVSGRTPNGAFSFITNAGKARVRGVEVEPSFRPMRGLSVSGNASYIDAVLTENQSNSNVSAAGLKGDRIPYVPKFSMGAAVEYKWTIAGDMDGLLRADATHTGGYHTDFRPNATYTRYIEGYELVNVRAGIDKPRWGAYVFATNLFNDLAITRKTSTAILLGRTLVNSATPRTIGVNFRAKF